MQTKRARRVKFAGNLHELRAEAHAIVQKQSKPVGSCRNRIDWTHYPIRQQFQNGI
jgi:hypothetical protein